MNKQQKIELLENELHILENRILGLLKELQRKDNIINEIEKYFFGELQLYGGGGIAEENYKKIIELKEKK